MGYSGPNEGPATLYNAVATRFQIFNKILSEISKFKQDFNNFQDFERSIAAEPDQLIANIAVELTITCTLFKTQPVIQLCI